ncbi:type VII secretion protein EccE [Mycolicibacillus parakoreensis]|uniref:Type VII secretion protein EccE n=1 Tax=Mycolicibacillus parakoreensis TaxID=1069221 RepID=A0ABY3U3U2_9MYCO|nr:type VII secretion protein EccE [Mycolicibacillus parakoreensis]MCV7316542.1 type VII secretion protein EccE [Mycolicibacillus parakoreensis]ULN52766.1 type VII secretion protein EccE [Mycolicibacillus parakoreensis]HLR98234.1 type VII secretion protein EccE [Mycolicibacillus parakoreensis]
MRRLAVLTAVAVAGLLGAAAGAAPGAAVGLGAGMLAAVVPFWGRPLWAWAGLWLGRHRTIRWPEAVTATNDRHRGGVRYHRGVAAVAVRVFGRAHSPTLLTGATSARTADVLDLATLAALLRQPLGLAVESISVVRTGSRRATTGSYPAVYDTLIGTPPYAGRRAMWLIIRIAADANVDALRWRTTVGSAAVASAQRIAAALRHTGIRAAVAGAGDIAALDARLTDGALAPRRRGWRALRADTGWLATYRYRPADITTAALEAAWTWRVEHIVQDITVFDDRTVAATVTVATAARPVAPPSVRLVSLPGRQARAVAAHRCGPGPLRDRTPRARLDAPVRLPIGPSGVLLGRLDTGRRLLVPLDDPTLRSRVYLIADDALTKRILIRLAATGARITCHSTDTARWSSLRMPLIALACGPTGPPGTTVGVVDGTVTPAPRPDTVIVVAASAPAPVGPGTVVITQTGPDTVTVATADWHRSVHVDLFRAENRYLGPAPRVPATTGPGG